MSEPVRANGFASRPSAIPWPPLLLFGCGAAAFLLGALVPLPWPGVDDLAARVIGLGFGGVGIALIAWAAATLYRERTTVMPHRGADHLVTTGPYTRRRNPIYLGDALIMLGLAELTHNIWFVVVVPVFVVAVTWLAILPEERHLLAKFGARYQDYMARTRRWL
ncbi:MAG: isoprenylcysteine carboxylmethyltransferase family protein [Hyphomicrobiaceae bacterium]|nr:isoprenylcysteine carboxylmethyltransferase family protein [Hyphomicrobiaceae bacterium]